MCFVCKKPVAIVRSVCSLAVTFPDVCETCETIWKYIDATSDECKLCININITPHCI